jgi:hypothetical protein
MITSRLIACSQTLRLSWSSHSFSCSQGRSCRPVPASVLCSSLFSVYFSIHVCHFIPDGRVSSTAKSRNAQSVAAEGARTCVRGQDVTHSGLLDWTFALRANSKCLFKAVYIPMESDGWEAGMCPTGSCGHALRDSNCSDLPHSAPWQTMLFCLKYPHNIKPKLKPLCLSQNISNSYSEPSV